MAYRKKNIIYREFNSLLFNLSNYAKNVASFALFIILQTTSNTNKVISNNIALVNTLYLGDVTLCLDFIDCVIKSGKYSSVYFIIRTEYGDYIRSLNKDIKIIELDLNKYRLSIKYRYHFISSIREHGCSTAINLSPDRGFINDEITLLIGASNKITLRSKSRFLFSPFINILNSFYDKISSDLILNEYLKLDHILNELEISKGKNEEIIFDNCQKTSDLPDKYIVIAPLSNDCERGISLDRYLEIAKHTANKFTVVIVGSKKQSKELEMFQGPNLINMVGLLTLNDIPQLINNCILFIGNDSGITHLAVKLGKTIIALIGGGMYGRFFPYPYVSTNQYYFYNEMECFNCSWCCHYERRYCLTEIDDKKVIKRIDLLLSQYS